MTPEPTLRRLAAYYHYLSEKLTSGIDIISCTAISEDLGFHPTQIRKDLAATGIVGKPKVGYSVKELLQSVYAYLGWDKPLKTIVAGVGNLGTALMGYERFNLFYGINIVAGFDKNPKKFGTKVNGINIYAIDKMSEIVRNLDIKVGVLSVPCEEAQNVCDALIAGGVSAILNFTPVSVKAPDGVIVEHAILASNIAVLSRRVIEKK